MASHAAEIPLARPPLELVRLWPQLHPQEQLRPHQESLRPHQELLHPLRLLQVHRDALKQELHRLDPAQLLDTCNVLDQITKLAPTINGVAFKPVLREQPALLMATTSIVCHVDKSHLQQHLQHPQQHHRQLFRPAPLRLLEVVLPMEAQMETRNVRVTPPITFVIMVLGVLINPANRVSSVPLRVHTSTVSNPKLQ